MNTFVTPIVAVLIAVFTSLNIAGCLWLIWWTAKRRPGEADTTGHTWDGIQEYNNPMPRWWLGLFLITIVFGLGYFALYPGLGAYDGSKHWTSVAQLEQEQAATRRAFDDRYASLANENLVALAKNKEAMATARNLFANNCSTCHGADARGAKGFPNLTDNDWLWGGDADTIYQTIAHGRKGAMPAWSAVLGQQGVEETAAYVVSLSGHRAPADWVKAGAQRFQTICVACHGVDAKGNQTLGAPNLTDKTWLYGASLATVRETIANGRNNEMPAHIDALGETKVRMLAAYVYSLSH